MFSFVPAFFVVIVRGKNNMLPTCTFFHLNHSVNLLISTKTSCYFTRITLHLYSNLQWTDIIVLCYPIQEQGCVPCCSSLLFVTFQECFHFVHLKSHIFILRFSPQYLIFFILDLSVISGFFYHYALWVLLCIRCLLFNINPESPFPNANVPLKLISLM